MSDNLSPTYFKIVWDQLAACQEESVPVVKVDEDFLSAFGLQSSDFDGDPFQEECVSLNEDLSSNRSVTHSLNPNPSSSSVSADMIPDPQNSCPTRSSSATNNEMPGLEDASVSSPYSNVTESVNENSTTIAATPCGSKEFVSMSNNEVQDFIDNQENVNTLKKTKNDIMKFRRFLETKDETREIHHIDVDQLDEYVANFILSVRKQNGEEYEPTSIRGIVSSLDRKLRRHGYAHSIIAEKTTAFSLTRNALKAKQKSLKRLGKGNKPHKAAPLTDNEINIMYEKNVLGDATPSSLLNTMWLNNMIHFGLRGTKEQYNLQWGDIALNKDSDGQEYLELNERQTKTRSGENMCDVRQVAPKMYENKQSKSRDPVALYKLYAEKRPVAMKAPETPFYIAPRTIPLKHKDDQWYLNQRVGEKKFGGLLKVMAQKAELDSNKNITNHSARKHLVQKLRDSNVAPTDIMHISGHKNIQSILNYSNISEQKQKECSALLSTHVPSAAAESASITHTATTNELTFTESTVAAEASSHHSPATDPGLGSLSTSTTNTTITAGENCYPTHIGSVTVENNSNNMLRSVFYGASLHINTLNVYCNK